MTQGGFGYRTAIHIEVRREGVIVGSRLASVAPCQEDALFGSILSGSVPNDGSLPSLAIAPTWSEEPDPPMGTGALQSAEITGVELRMVGSAPRRYGKQVFAAQARDLIETLILEGTLPLDAKVEWSLVEGPGDEPPPAHFAVRVSREPLPLSPARLPRTAKGEISAELDASMLDGLRREFCQAGAVERAWLLVGSVDHDPERGAAAIQAVTAVPVEMGRGGASRTHFAFEPGAFVEARERAKREFDDLVPIGWAHSHPPCEACPANPACQSDTRFFSEADIEVHSSAFASPYMIALVVGKVATAPATEPGFHLYGWRQALVSKIDYRATGPGH
jgi:proteasome lid subunit RPN8/RPN11